MAKMGKKFLGLSIFYWVLIVLVVLFFVYGMGRVSEGFYAEKKIQKNGKSCDSYDKNGWDCEGAGFSGPNRYMCRCTK